MQRHNVPLNFHERFVIKCQIYRQKFPTTSQPNITTARTHTTYFKTILNDIQDPFNSKVSARLLHSTQAQTLIKQHLHPDFKRYNKLEARRPPIHKSIVTLQTSSVHTRMHIICAHIHMCLCV